MRGSAILATLLLVASPAEAGLSRATLAKIEAAPKPGARLDLSLAARDLQGRVRSIGQILDGRPAFVNFVDYTCNTLCGTDLMLLADGLKRAGLDPARFRIIVIGIDPKDPASAARTMAEHEIPPRLRSASVFLLPDARMVKAATTALGYRYAYDAATDQFAHPAAVYAVGRDGVVRAVLSPLSLLASDLSAAVTIRNQPTLLQRIHSLCYAYDPLTGAYNLRVTWLLRIGALTTLVLLSIGILLLARRGRLQA